MFGLNNTDSIKRTNKSIPLPLFHHIQHLTLTHHNQIQEGINTKNILSVIVTVELAWVNTINDTVHFSDRPTLHLANTIVPV